MALMTCEEFRNKRDQFALDGYRLRWPILNAKKQAFLKQMALIEAQSKTYVFTESAKKHAGEEKEAIRKQYYAVINEMAMIEADAPIRKMALGLIPMPQDISTATKMRVDIMKGQYGPTTSATTSLGL